MSKRNESARMELWEYQISYSQSSILADLFVGSLLLLGGAALALWSKSWVFVTIVLAGLSITWKAVTRTRNQGHPLKIGHQGIWTKAIGFLPWSEAKLIIEQQLGTRTATTYLIIQNRQHQHRELARFNIDDLDIDSHSLEVYLNKFSSSYN